MSNTINQVSNLNFRAVTNDSKPCAVHENCNENHKSVDITDLYTQENIVDILKETGAYRNPIYPCKYSVEYYFESGALVINNTNMTNDTTVIDKDGTVTHGGSWHNKEIGKEEKYAEIVNDALERIDAMEK